MTLDAGRFGPRMPQIAHFLYHITEEKKLINVHGTGASLLIKFLVSNDLLHRASSFFLRAESAPALLIRKPQGMLCCLWKKDP